MRPRRRRLLVTQVYHRTYGRRRRTEGCFSSLTDTAESRGRVTITDEQTRRDFIYCILLLHLLSSIQITLNGMQFATLPHYTARQIILYPVIRFQKKFEDNPQPPVTWMSENPASQLKLGRKVTKPSSLYLSLYFHFPFALL